LFVASRGSAGAGGENYLLSIFRHMDRAAYTPVVVLPEEGSLRPLLEGMDIEVHLLEPPGEHGWLKPPKPWYRFLGGMQERCRRLAELIEERGIRLVHTNSNIYFEGALAAQLAGVPHIYLAHIERQTYLTLHQRFNLDQSSFGRIMDALSDRIIAVSESVAATLRPAVHPDKLMVIHNGIEPDRFLAAMQHPPFSLREELGLPAETPLVTAVGRINPDKGFDFFIEAAAQVAQRDRHAHFLLVGGDEIASHAGALRERVAALPQLADRFHFLGFREEVPEILAQSDIFVLSSRREGHPYVLLEAMAARCAPVASECAGVAETIRHGETGFTHPVGDLAAMADQIAALLGDQVLREHVADAAFDEVLTRFTAATTAQRLFREYQALLSAPSRQVPGNAGVALFLQMCNELSWLGLELEAVKEQLREVEGSTRFLRENPLRRGLRRLRRALSGEPS
jgi:glycosyltransferase involved in cell wall biosynthesis